MNGYNALIQKLFTVVMRRDATGLGLIGGPFVCLIASEGILFEQSYCSNLRLLKITMEVNC